MKKTNTMRFTSGAVLGLTALSIALAESRSYRERCSRILLSVRADDTLLHHRWSQA